MFCQKCGAKLRDDAQFCQKCGSPVYRPEAVQTKAGQAEPPQQAASQPVRQVVYQTVYQSQPRPYYAPGTHPYHHLGGFLLFHVVASYIGGVASFISIITTIISFATQMKMSNWLPDSFKGVLVFDMLGSVIISLVTGCVAISYANQIRRKDSNVLHFAQSSTLVLVIANLLFRLLELLSMQQIFKQYNYSGGILPGLTAGMVIFMIVIGATGLSLMSLYYARSVRVRTYMGSADYLRKSLFNKNTASPLPADGSDQPGVVSPDVAVIFDPKKQWYCTQCGRINENYTTTCRCGMAKPSGDLSQSWICKICGSFNMGNLHQCYYCGNAKHREISGWICQKCGSQNNKNASTCRVCSTSRPNKAAADHEPEALNDWVCPDCGTVNACYVGTCGYGRKKSP